MKKGFSLLLVLAMLIFFPLQSFCESGEETKSVAEIAQAIKLDVENTLEALNDEYEALTDVIEDYDTYVEHAGEVMAFYEEVNNTSQILCIRIQLACADYAEAIIREGGTKDEIYNTLSDIYDVVYEDAGDDIYDSIYDGILDDIYDVFYNGALDDSDAAPFGEWSKVRSSEYKAWSQSRSGTYKDWSSFRSDVYKLWSRLRSDVFSGKIDRALEKVDDFREDAEKSLKKYEETMAKRENKGSPTESNTTQTEFETNEKSDVSPAFKKSMDEYEAFFDEYIAFVEKYNSSSNQLSLMQDYASFMQKYVSTMYAMEQIDTASLSDADMLYYTEVMLRITQKLADVM